VLCRSFLKGRDWYDFSWYVVMGVVPNLTHLEAALMQFGPWAARTGLDLDTAWLERELGHQVISIDGGEAQTDVRRFLPPVELRSLSL